MLKDGTLTYVSLFSSAGVGCYGFQMEGFHCIATNELLEKRMRFQRSNSKCEFDSGYIAGDITNPEVKGAVYREIDRWKKTRGNDRVDVVMATPPCQGISVINHNPAPTAVGLVPSVDTPNNLGIVVKAYRILELKPIIQTLLDGERGELEEK